MKIDIDTKLLAYVPKRDRLHISMLYREDNHICIVMNWEDGFSRSRVADNIEEMKDFIKLLEYNRYADF